MVLAQAQQIVTDPSQLKEMFGSTPILIGDIVVDVLLTETPIYAWDLTTHPVEAGLDITDSRYKKPTGVVLDCIFTDPEFSIDDFVEDAVSAIATGGSLKDANPFAKATWQEKRDSLEKLQLQNIRIDVVTPNGTYPAMMIKSNRPIFDKDKANAYFFRIEFGELRTVSSNVVSIDDSQIPEDLKKKKNEKAAKKTAKKAKKGKKAVSPAGAKRQSTLDKLIGKYL